MERLPRSAVEFSSEKLHKREEKGRKKKYFFMVKYEDIMGIT